MTRDDVFKAINTERDYQQRRWGHRQANGVFVEHVHTTHAYVLFMQDYLEEARKILSRNEEPQCWEEVLGTLRKVVTLGVACFEQHGVPSRNPDAPVVNGRDGQPA